MYSANRHAKLPSVKAQLRSLRFDFEGCLFSFTSSLLYHIFLTLSIPALKEQEREPKARAGTNDQQQERKHQPAEYTALSGLYLLYIHLRKYAVCLVEHILFAVLALLHVTSQHKAGSIVKSVVLKLQHYYMLVYSFYHSFFSFFVFFNIYLPHFYPYNSFFIKQKWKYVKIFPIFYLETIDILRRILYNKLVNR